METTYIPHSLIDYITIIDNYIWIYTYENIYYTNESFTTDSNGITGIFIKHT